MIYLLKISQILTQQILPLADQVQLDTFHPPHHKLRPSFESKLDALLKEYPSQFAKDEMSIGTTPLTEMTTDMGTSDPVYQKPYLIAMKNYQWVKDKIEKFLTAKVIHSSRSSWSVPIIEVPKGVEESNWSLTIVHLTKSPGNSLGLCQKLKIFSLN